MSRFEESVKSTAFSLQLSKRMVGVLLSFDGGDEDATLNMAPYQALKRRGLIGWNINEQKGPSLTEEGKLVCKLLRMANY